MFIPFLVSMIGFLLVHRFFSSSVKEFAISKSAQRSFLIFMLFLNLLMVASFHSSPVVLWLFIGIIMISLKFFPFFLRFFLNKRFSKSFVSLLDSVILGLQTGKSFRVALHGSIESQNGWRRNQLREIYNSLITSELIVSTKSTLIKDFQAELLEIDRSQNRVLDQVKALRGNIKMSETFRRRSGQVTQQIKMQALIVTALFIALLIFVILQFGFNSHRHLILLAVSVFSVGLFWIFNVGRRMKWKV